MTFLPFLETRGLFKRYKHFGAHSSPRKWKCESNFLQLRKSTKTSSIKSFCLITTE